MLHKIAFTILINLCLFEVIAQPINAPEITEYIDGLEEPVALVHAGDRSERLFVVGKKGTIQVIEQGRLQTYPILDISDKVFSNAYEAGLLGLAFHPEFPDTPYFYVNYNVGTSEQMKTIVSRFTMEGNSVDRRSEMTILEFDQPYANHNGGTILFGQDGYLYIGTGDGGSAGDPQNLAQDLTTLLGKMLRIDVNRSENGNNYSIPSGNPFVNADADQRPEIFAYGLRNPWKFTQDPITGNIWAGDVGQDRREAIHLIENGLNYGWRILEGSLCFEPRECDPQGLELPVWEYTLTEGNCTVIGGYVYRGRQLEGLRGHYIYADHCSGNVWAIEYDHEGNRVKSNEFLFDTDFLISSMGQDEDNELYILDYSNGRILRFIDSYTTSMKVERPVKAFTIGPRPVTQASKIRLHLNQRSNATIEVLNRKGELIQTISKGRLKKGRHVFSWKPLPDIGKEPYIFRLRIDDGDVKYHKEIILNDK